MKKLLLCITVLSLWNMGHSAYGMMEEQPALKILSKTEQKALNKQLLEATKNENLEGVKKMITAGANVNASHVLGETPLNQAAFRGNIKIVKVLLNAGASVQDNKIRTSPLAQATTTGHPKLMQILLAAGAKMNNNTLLSLAVEGISIKRRYKIYCSGARGEYLNIINTLLNCWCRSNSQSNRRVL